MSQTSSRAQLAAQRRSVAACLAAAGDQDGLLAHADVFQRNRYRPLLQFGVDGNAVGVEEPAADLARRPEGDELVEHPRVKEAALEQRGRRRHSAHAEQHHVGAPAGLERAGDQ